MHQPLGRIRSVAPAVAHAPCEQKPSASVRVLGLYPPLLFGNDFGDLVINEDGVGCDIDLALRVAEPGQDVPLGCGGVRGRREAVEVARPDLTGTAAGEDLQQDHAHCLGVVEAVGGEGGAVAAGDGHLLRAGQADQRQRRGDLGECVVIDVVRVVESALMRYPGDSAEPARGMCRSHPLPSRVGSFGLVP